MSLCSLCLGGPSAVKVSGYNLQVCSVCWQAAENGWDKRWEPQLFSALQRSGLLIPDRNERGRLPRSYAPPADFAL